MIDSVTLDWADNWFTTSRPKSDEWTNTEPEERQKYLNWSLTLIRTLFVFPNDFDSANETVKVAVCEQALWLLRRTDEYPPALTQGLSQAAAGSLSATFDKSFIAPLVYAEVVNLLKSINVDFVGGNENKIESRPLGL